MSGKSRNKPVRFAVWIPVFLILAATVAVCIFGWPHFETVTAQLPVVPVRIGDKKDPSLYLVTAYCNCGRCCSWHRRYWLFGEPVYDSGPRKGRPKDVGRTASGRYAKPGTVAADPKVFPMGTRLEIPGYGLGRVEDTGGAITGRHIDVWFPTHDEARRWGRRYLPVRLHRRQDNVKKP